MTGKAHPSFAAACVAILTALLTGCSSGGTQEPAPAPAATTQAVHPPKAVDLHGPLAVLTTNAARQGRIYDVLLITAAGAVAARTTARLPTTKVDQRMDLPLTSMSRSRVYYLDGSTTVRSLLLDGTTREVTHIPGGATANVAFAVSPDDTRIAVALLAEHGDGDATTDTVYVEDLHGGHRTTLLSLTGRHAYRWPMGWSGGRLILALRAAFGCGDGILTGGDSIAGRAGEYGFNCVGAYNVVDASTGNRIVKVCEGDVIHTPRDSIIPTGAITARGVACLDYDGGYGLAAWDGTRATFARLENSARIDCSLSPDTTHLACSGSSTPVAAAIVINRDGAVVSLGYRNVVLGWVGPARLLVVVDASTLDLVDLAGNAVARVTLDGADGATMVGAVTV